MTYRNELAALTARKTALEGEIRDRTRELEDARQLVDELQARTRLPVLDNIRVAAPCSASWAAMTGTDRVRACGDCNKNVYNLSEMTRDEAEALIAEKEGRLCVRYFQRSDGTILLKDCGVGVKRRRRRRFVAAGVAASLAASVYGYVRTRHATMGEPVEQARMGDISQPRQITMGKIAPPPPVAVEVPEPGQVKMGGLAAPERAPDQLPRKMMGQVHTPSPRAEITGELVIDKK
jgi:hypothetical protein